MAPPNDRLGESFESFLLEEGTRDETYEVALKRVIAWQLEEARKTAALSKTEMAEAMGTSRSQLDRVLDPENVSVSIQTLVRAAAATGKRLKIELEDDAA
jgi:predicted XRE-type DNA-binding protein